MGCESSQISSHKAKVFKQGQRRLFSTCGCFAASYDANFGLRSWGVFCFGLSFQEEVIVSFSIVRLFAFERSGESETLGSSVSFGGVFLEHLFEQEFVVFWDIESINVDLILHDHFDHPIVVSAVERNFSSDQFVSDNSSRPNINFFIVDGGVEGLRSLVVEGSGLGPHLELGISLFFLDGTVEVNKFYFFVFWVVKDILRFDISVAYSLLVKLL